nr:hypothetical protein [Tanacetum cinerariifolium]
EPSYNQNYDDNYYSHESLSLSGYDNCGESHETFQCQPMDQNIDFSGSDQIQTPQYPEIHHPSQETSDEVFQAKESLKNSSDEIAASNPNQEKEEPSQDSDFHQLIEECSTEICEKQNALNSKLLLINSNSQRLKKEQQEVKNVVEHPVERGNRKSDEVTESNAENLLPIPSEYEVTLEDESKCDLPIYENVHVCDNSDTFSDSKIDDDISIYDDDFEDIEYVKASLFDPEIVNQEEENVVQQEKEEVDLEDISQIQDVVLCVKLLSITRLISYIESLNDNPTPNRVLNSFESDKSLSDNFSAEFEIFCDHSEETRSGNTTHADNSFLEYDSFCFEIEPDQERLINLMKNNIPDDSSNDSLLEEADLFLA